MERNVEFDHAIGAKVVIQLNGLSGTVVGQFNGREGKQSLVEYVRNDGGIESRYFRADEVAAA